MKRLVFLMICTLVFISCNKDQDKLPQSGTWTVNTEFGSFVFIVDGNGAYITEIGLTHSNWSCGGVTLGGTVTISSDPGWIITNSHFTIEPTIGPSSEHHTVIITGTFSTNGREASGTWEETLFGSTCSGSWEGSY